MTPQLLRAATGCTAEAAERFAEPLSAACAFYGIDTPVRLAAFLAQIGHESVSLKHTTEIWGPTPAQSRYEGRADLGNTQPGDGRRFSGHGLIQTTGRYNHARVRDRLRERFPSLGVPDFEAEPDALTLPQWAALSAADYWDDRGLNALADAGDFVGITRKINGGVNGLADRRARWERAKAALLSAPLPASESPAAADPGLPAPIPTPQEHTMPVPGLILGLASSLINVFGPLAKEKIQKEMARHTDNVEVQEQISNGVVQAAQAITGIADPIEAVVAVRADPELVQQVQQTTLDELERMAPMLEKMAQWEREALADSDASRNAAAQRLAIAKGDEPFLRFGGWLTLNFIQFLSLVLVGTSIGGAITLAVLDKLDEQLIGAIVTLMLIAGYTGVREFWLGSSRGSASKDIVISQLARKP